MILVVFGVAGAGKTTVGKMLADHLNWQFYDADDFHPQANIEKMRRREALTDEDRDPWLHRLRDLIQSCIAANQSAVLACSALKKKYRDELRASQEVKLIFLRADRSRVIEQLKSRPAHFFSPHLVDTQFQDLEEPKSADDAITVEITGEPRDVVKKIETILRQDQR